MKMFKRIITITLAFIMLMNISSIFGLKAKAADTQIFGKICPLCHEECGYYTEPRFTATLCCIEGASYYVYCGTYPYSTWGMIERTCYTAPDPNRHINTETKYGKPATCTEAGYTDGEYCNDCHQWIVKQEYIAPLHPEGHNFEKSSICTLNKVEYRCKICGYYYKEAKEPKAHTEGEWIVVKEPTCTAKGTAEKRCTECNYRIESKELPPNGHQWTDWAVIQPPTATADGQKIRTCSICKNNQTDIIPAGTSSRFIKSITLNDIQLNYKAGATLSPSIVSADGAKIKLKYTSSNPNVVSVNNNESITALKTGTAIIKVSAEDADGIITEDTCTVTVSYAWWQWIIRILLLGFLWY